MTQPHDTDDVVAVPPARSRLRRRGRDQTPPQPWFDQASPDGPITPPGTAPGTDPDAGTAPDADSDPDADLFDDGWVAPRRTNRLTAILVIGVVAAGAFAGGAYAQRSHDAGLTATSAANRSAGAGAFAGAFGGGQLPPGFGGGAGGGAGAGAGGAGAGGGAGGAGAGAATPIVVGTVSAVQGSTITVKNFAGAAVVVHVPATASVTTTGTAGLRPGATVSVVGTKSADGSVNATSVVSRRAG